MQKDFFLFQLSFLFFFTKKTWLCLNNYYHITVINIIIYGLASSIDRPDIKELNSMNKLLIKPSEPFKETGFLMFTTAIFDSLVWLCGFKYRCISSVLLHSFHDRKSHLRSFRLILKFKMFFSFTLWPPYASLITEDAVQICFAILSALSVGLKQASPNPSVNITLLHFVLQTWMIAQIVQCVENRYATAFLKDQTSTQKMIKSRRPNSYLGTRI